MICLDGDDSVLMHMGSLAIMGQSRQENLLHVVLNNGAHNSVGGQPTCAFAIDLSGIAPLWISGGTGGGRTRRY